MQVPQIPKPVIEASAIKPKPKKPTSRLRQENPALTAKKRIGVKMDADAQAQAAASQAQRESSRQEAIAEWKKML